MLRERGHVIVEPDEGLLACGMVGPGTAGRAGGDRGRRARREQEEHARRDLEGETVLITAGPTQEPIDAVRYLSNRSSGKMGYALAEEAARAGRARDAGFGTREFAAAARASTLVPVRTALEMREAVMDHLERSHHHHQGRGGRRLSLAQSVRSTR